MSLTKLHFLAFAHHHFVFAVLKWVHILTPHITALALILVFGHFIEYIKVSTLGFSIKIISNVFEQLKLAFRKSGRILCRRAISFVQLLFGFPAHRGIFSFFKLIFLERLD